MLIIALSLAAILYTGTGYASTVILIGSCHTSFGASAPNGTLGFNLANQGNGTAAHIIVVPSIGGASANNSAETYSLLAPFANHTFDFKLYNASIPGIYPEYFTVEYDQGSISVFEVFPCLSSIKASTTSLVSIIGMSKKNNKIIANLYSLSSKPLNVTLSTAVPPNIRLSPSSMNVLMQPNSEYNATFNITTRNITTYGSLSNASFTLSVFTSYVQNGMHYSSLGYLPITQNAPVSHPFPVFLIAVAAIFVAIIALIALSVVKGRKTKAHKSAAGADAR